MPLVPTTAANAQGGGYFIKMEDQNGVFEGLFLGAPRITVKKLNCDRFNIFQLSFGTMDVE